MARHSSQDDGVSSQQHPSISRRFSDLAVSEKRSHKEQPSFANAQIQDIYIAVMGVTGAGKSTFISTCSGKQAKIGHSLQSCTTEVEDFWFMFSPAVRVHLIDTPGFDDTNLSDVQVLQNIAHWLANSFKEGVRLSGIIFMHRICDPRLGGSAKRNLLIFKKLCGEKAYQSVVLATTMWGKVSCEEGESRERELVDEPKYWGAMHKRGSKVFRYMNTRESALKLVDYIMSLHSSVTLDIQDEIVNKHRNIDETSAAHQLNLEIIEERKKHEAELKEMREQMTEAIEEHDEELEKEFKEEIEKLQEKLNKSDEEQVKLRQTLEEVDKRKEAEFAAFKDEMLREREADKKRFEAQTNTLQNLMLASILL